MGKTYPIIFNFNEFGMHLSVMMAVEYCSAGVSTKGKGRMVLLRTQYSVEDPKKKLLFGS